MKHDLRDLRPAFISEGNALVLDEFRRFRHLVRSVNAMDLIPDKLLGLDCVARRTLRKILPNCGTVTGICRFSEKLARAT